MCNKKASFVSWLMQWPQLEVYQSTVRMDVPLYRVLYVVQRSKTEYNRCQLVVRIFQKGERETHLSAITLNSAKKGFQRHSEWLLWLLNCILFFILLFRWTARHKCPAIKSFLSLEAQNNWPRVGRTWLPSGILVRNTIKSWSGIQLLHQR